jgi:hypothetical protein
VDTRHPRPAGGEGLEHQIDAWRAHLRRASAVAEADAAELEDHLREQIAGLGDRGLSDDEAFLVAVKRMGSLDALTREFALEHSERLWKQLVLAGDAVPAADGGPAPTTGNRRMWAALLLATAAGAAIKVPALFGIGFDDGGALFYSLNMSFFTLPFITAWFAWERRLPSSGRAALAAFFVAAAAGVNALPFAPVGPASDPPDTQLLLMLHLPIALWFAVGVAYVGGRWPGNERRMDFLRFTGEAFIYYVLIALGGGVLMGTTFALFDAIGIDVEPIFGRWVLPCGIAGATVVAAWLVEAKQSVVENMAPVLARVFTPLFALVLVTFVSTMIVTGRGIDADREVLIAVDLLLVVVFALLLYAISARDALAPADAMDWIQLGLVGLALVVDALALWAIGSRISDFGSTPNRLAALGMNVVLLGNLAGAGILYLRFVRGAGTVRQLWEWQTAYLYVIAAWVAVVAFIFPPLFGFD